MTILENNSSRLVVQLTYHRIVLLVAGASLLISLLLALLPNSTTFACKRVEPKEGYCELITAAILNSSTRRFVLGQIEKVRTITSTTTDFRGKQQTDYSVQLETTVGNVEIVKTVSLGEQHQWADQLNFYLSNTLKSDLTLNQDGRLWVYAISAAFLGFGLWIAMAILRVTTYIFDRTLGKLVIEHRLGGTWTKEYPLDDIRDLEIRLHENPRDDRKNYRQLYFELKADRYIATSLPDENDLIILIRTFLGTNRPLP